MFAQVHSTLFQVVGSLLCLRLWLPQETDFFFLRFWSCSVVLYSPWNSLCQNTGVGSLSLLQGIFPTQGSNPGLLHCRRILYQLSHKGSPKILEWVAYPFSRGSSLPQESNPGLLHCRWILYQLSYQGTEAGIKKCCHLVEILCNYNMTTSAPCTSYSQGLGFC